MTDQNGALTEDDWEKIDAWMKKKFGGEMKCPLCGGVEWMVSDWLTVISAYKGPMAVPHVAFSSDCGYPVLLNAVDMGILAGRS